MLNWIVESAEWIFSGIGVALFSGIITLVMRILSDERKKNIAR